MEDHRTPANKYQKHRQGLAHRLIAIQHQLEQLTEKIGAVLDQKQQQEGHRDDCHR